MARRRAQVLPDLDDAAPPTPPLAPGAHDVDRAQALLEWARKRGYRIGPILEVGCVRMQVADLRLQKREALAAKDGDAPPGTIYDDYGFDDDEPAEGTIG